MEDSKNTSRAKTVLKFLFLPGISRSISQMSFLKPVFMRLIGGIFERAGLIRRDHPALYYGAEGAEETTLHEVIVEALNTIKSTGGNYYQLGLFSATCLMIAFTLFAAGASVFMTTGYLVDTAQAQLFAHPTNNPTDMASIPNLVSRSEAGAFNYYLYSGKAGHEDWGITILNKLFREGIAGKGGVLQNSFGALMEIFNTAVLTIAGAMILWLIISIVIDTAKTGVVGGGRHNMVWAPIRIIFALGLIIPLGTTGFSAGQMMVIKLAEWGSNLGTTAWVTFVTRASSSNMMSSTNIENFNHIVDGYTRMWACRVSYNALFAAGGYSDTAGVISEFQVKGSTKKGQYGSKKVVYNFGNSRGDSCGTISYPTEMTDIPAGSGYEGSINAAIRTYINAVSTTFVKPMVGDNLATPNFQNDSSFNKTTIKFACSIAHMEIAEDKLETSECGNAGWSSGSCNESPKHNTDSSETSTADASADPGLPDYECYSNMLKSYGDQIKSGLEKANNNLQNAISDKSQLVNEAKKQGWPSMGWWYYELYKLDTLVMGAGKSSIEISPAGGVGKGPVNAGVKNVAVYYDKWWEKILNNEDLVAQQDYLQAEINSDTAVTGGGVTIKNAGISGDMSDIAGSLLINPIKNTWDKMDFKFSFPPNKDSNIMSSIGKLVYEATKGMGNAAIAIFMSPLSGMWGSIKADIASDMYPLAKLISIGQHMMDGGSELIAVKTAVYLIGTLFGIGSAIPFLGGLFSTPYNIVAGLVNGPIGQFMQAAATAIIAASAIPLYYVPMMPFIKVAFSVLTWIMSVFEAVIMVPIAALSHITTQGEGMVVSKQPWLVWMNMLLRPTLTVIGFVGSILVLNTFVLYWSYGFGKALDATDSMMNAGSAIGGAAKAVALAAMYCVGIYTAANASFSLLESIPAAFFKYMGGQADVGPVQEGGMAGAAAKGGDVGGMAASAAPKAKKIKSGGGSGGGGSTAQNVASDKGLAGKSMDKLKDTKTGQMAGKAKAAVGKGVGAAKTAVGNKVGAAKTAVGNKVGAAKGAIKNSAVGQGVGKGVGAVKGAAGKGIGGAKNIANKARNSEVGKITEGLGGLAAAGAGFAARGALKGAKVGAKVGGNVLGKIAEGAAGGDD